HHDDRERAARQLQNADAPRAGDEDLRLAVAIDVADGAESVVGRVEQPAAEARSVRGHHRYREGAARSLEDADAPGTRDQHFGLAVTIEVADRTEAVVDGIEQPTAETGAVRRHDRRGQRASGELQHADAPW